MEEEEEVTPTPTPEEDTTPPVLTVPKNRMVEASSTEGAVVTYTVTAEDNVDGTATLEADGITITQDDDVGGDIRIFCTPASGERFPIDTTTTVTCTARDAAGNEGTASFTITVQDTTPTPTVFCYAVEFTSGIIRTHCFSTEEECGAGEGINRAQAGVARIVSSCEGFETHPAGAESCFIAPGDPEFGIPPQVACSA